MADSSTSNNSFVLDLYRQMKKYTLSYIYRGDFSDDLSSKILSLAETNMEHSSEPNSLKKKVYFIMVESLQNITRHQTVTEKESTDKSSFFVIQRLEKEYYITSGNVVANEKIEDLKANLNKINSLDKDDLKTYAKEILAQGDFSEKGGAGLGFIEMARKSGNKLAYDFKKIDDKLSHFYFQTTISLPESEHLPSNHDDIDEGRLGWLENLDKEILDRNLNLIYQVDFTQESLLGILAMAEGNIGSEQELILRKKVFNTIVELLQNISKHADDPDTDKEGKSGIFLLGEKNGVYILTTGNLILNSRVEGVKRIIEQVNGLDVPSLNTLYNQKMMTDDEVGQKGAGLGFIDIKLKSNSNLTYGFTKIDDVYSFFEIEIKLA